jgi:hypothetical protein
MKAFCSREALGEAAPRSLGLPRIIIVAFLLALCMTGAILGGM